MEIVAFLPDEHRGYSINTNPVYNFLADLKPTVFIKGGDALDLAYLSHWNETAPGKFEGQRLKKDYDAEGKQLDEIRAKIKPHRMIYMIGNHENWIRQFIDKFPQLEGVIDVPIGLKLRERGVECIPLNKSVKIGKLHYIHGIYTGTSHARQTALAYQRCVRYGHTHDFQVHSVVSALDESQGFNAKSCGCLCNRNPEYNHGRPNKWVHGFNVAYIMPDGTFYDYFVPIVKKKFVWNGKVYQ